MKWNAYPGAQGADSGVGRRGKPSGEQRVQRKLAQTTAPIPFQKVDWPTRSQYLKRLTQLRIERSTWITHWEDLSWHVRPRQSRFTSTDKNIGYRKDKLIINSRATKDLRTLVAGMMAGFSNPAQPWFKLKTHDSQLTDVASVKDWLQEVEKILLATFAKSNFYEALLIVYEMLGLYGTAAGVMEEDFKDVLRMYVQPIGAFMLAQSGACRVDSLYREISLTTGQLVSRFGLENCSNFVQWNWRKGNYDLWVYIIHVLEPNRAVDNVRWEAKFKKIRSAWFELGAYAGTTGYDTTDSGYTGEPLNFLMEGGFDEMPAICPRWQLAGMEDIYGESPYMDGLGDIRQLQSYERTHAKLLAKLADPPMKGPASMKNGRPSISPGDFTAVDDSAKGATFEPAMTIDPRGLEFCERAIQRIEQRIDAISFADLWLMLQQLDDQGHSQQRTATEIAERKEEKLLMLGPVAIRLHNELFGPAIDRAFAIHLRNGLLPPPPAELQGVDLQVEYISPLAQAQKILGVEPLQSTVSFATALAQLRPDAVDNLNVDGMVENFADAVGLKPTLILSADEVAQVRQQRAQQQEQARQAQLAEQAGGAAKSLAGADLSGDNGLSRLLGSIGQAPGGAA